VFLGGVELDIVEEFKYLGVTLDPTLSFKRKTHQTLSEHNKIQSTVHNFKQIRSLKITSAKMFLHSMIFSHIYCITTWSLTEGTILEPIKIYSKKSIEIFDLVIPSL